MDQNLVWNIGKVGRVQTLRVDIGVQAARQQSPDLPRLQELAERIQSWTASSTSPVAIPSPDEPAENVSSPVMVWRSREPLSVHFRDGSMIVQLHVDEMRTDKGNFSHAAIEVTYECAIDQGRLLLKRSSPPIVRLRDAESSSGRQQTLKRLLARQLARSLPDHVIVQPDRWLEGSATGADLWLECKELQVGDGWIQLAGSCPAP